MVQADGNTVTFQVRFCPNCGRAFGRTKAENDRLHNEVGHLALYGVGSIIPDVAADILGKILIIFEADT